LIGIKFLLGFVSTDAAPEIKNCVNTPRCSRAPVTPVLNSDSRDRNDEFLAARGRIFAQRVDGRRVLS
jgi:hypothetical protein